MLLVEAVIKYRPSWEVPSPQWGLAGEDLAYLNALKAQCLRTGAVTANAPEECIRSEDSKGTAFGAHTSLASCMDSKLLPMPSCKAGLKKAELCEIQRSCSGRCKFG